MQTHFGHQSLLNPCFDRKIAFRTYASSISTPERQQSQNGAWHAFSSIDNASSPNNCIQHLNA